MVTLPLAVLGGVLGLRALGLFAFQPLDLLSMIGFIMLLGMVVNNAILLIAQTREAQDEGARARRRRSSRRSTSACARSSSAR